MCGGHGWGGWEGIVGLLTALYHAVPRTGLCRTALAVEGCIASCITWRKFSRVPVRWPPRRENLAQVFTCARALAGFVGDLLEGSWRRLGSGCGHTLPLRYTSVPS